MVYRIDHMALFVFRENTQPGFRFETERQNYSLDILHEAATLCSNFPYWPRAIIGIASPGCNSGGEMDGGQSHGRGPRRRPRDRAFTFDVSHLTWMCPGITTAKFCEARTVAGIEG